MASRTETAVVVTTADGAWAESNKEVPQCSPNSLLVMVHSVALNPSDHKMPLRVKTAGLSVGIDFAGQVVEVGTQVNEVRTRSKLRPWMVGDRVCGSVHGSNLLHPNWGSFAHFVEADPVVLTRIPPAWDWTTAGAVGGSVHGSVGLALFNQMRLDDSKLRQLATEATGAPGGSVTTAMAGGLSNEALRKVVLVYGGSTACGTMAIQILRFAGYIPIATCSSHNKALVDSYGAAATFDYRSDQCVAAIRTYTKGALGFALDCIGTAQSATFCYSTFGRAGGRYVALEKYPDVVAATRKAVKGSWAMGPTMFGRKIVMGEGYSSEADHDARAFAGRWYPLFESLAQAGIVRSHPIRTVDGPSWPQAVISGLGWLREGSVSGQKLVVNLHP